MIDDLFAALDQLRAEAATILLVDQMAGLALALADRAYVLEGGRIVASRHDQRNCARRNAGKSLPRSRLGLTFKERSDEHRAP